MVAIGNSLWAQPLLMISPNPMYILGITGFHHSVQFKTQQFPELSSRERRIAQGFDSAAALISENGIQAAAAEERFSREKSTNAFPVKAIRYCLEAGGIGPEDISYVAHGFDYEAIKETFQGRDYFEAPVS